MVCLLKDSFECKTLGRINSNESNWYQAANPQHITTNNNVEGTNQSFKKLYTGRTWLSFPNMFNKLKELLTDWARTNGEENFDPEKLPVDMVKSAEEMLTKCRNDDKKNTLLLGKAAKATHKNMVKENFGIVRGFVKEINIIPRNPELLCKSSRSLLSLGRGSTPGRTSWSTQYLMTLQVTAKKLPLSRQSLRS